MKRKLLTIAIILLTQCSCTKYAHYQNPLQNNTNTYKEIPLYNDSISSAFYASGTICMTEANQLRDSYHSFQGAIHRTQKFSAFQAYYGATASLGNYHVGPLDQGEPGGGIFDFYNYGINDSIISTNSGNKFFGSVGLIGGVNMVYAWKNGEWRILGGGLAINNEFGKYLDFRTKLPDTAANLLDRNRRTLNILLTPDYIRKTRQGNAGFQLAYVVNPKRMAGFDANGRRKIYQSGYLSSTLHITVDKITGFLQWSLGTFTAGTQLGANYRLSW